MHPFRRFSALLALAALPLALLAGPGRRTAPAKSYRVFVGTYTHETESKGVYQFQFDPASGKMSGLELAGESKNPSWVVVDRQGKFLYAANETGKSSSISAFAIAAKSGKLQLLNEVSAEGQDPCHLSFDRSGKFLLVANYSSGNLVVFPILPDGKLGRPTAALADRGQTGPDRQRQDGPHAHWIGSLGQAGAAETILVADLGLDRVFLYDFDKKSGKLALPDEQTGRRQNSLALQPGTGPRHLAVVAQPYAKTTLYVLGELDSTVTVFRNSKEGVFSTRPDDKFRTLPAGFAGRNDAAEIEVHPNGKFLYASNRGEDSIAVYRIAAGNGKLQLLQDVPTGGKEPRHFSIAPGGRFLLAENQNSNSIFEFRIDPASGKLTPTGEKLAVPSPICLAFHPLP
jgi:6-phosphogluconolactonase